MTEVAPHFVITVVVRPDDSVRQAPDVGLDEPVVTLEVSCKWQHLDDVGTVEVIPLGTLDRRPIVLGSRECILEEVRAGLVEHGDQLQRALEKDPILPSLPERTLDFRHAPLEVDLDARLGRAPEHRFPVTRTNVPNDDDS